MKRVGLAGLLFVSLFLCFICDSCVGELSRFAVLLSVLFVRLLRAALRVLFFGFLGLIALRLLRFRRILLEDFPRFSRSGIAANCAFFAVPSDVSTFRFSPSCFARHSG